MSKWHGHVNLNLFKFILLRFHPLFLNLFILNRIVFITLAFLSLFLIFFLSRLLSFQHVHGVVEDYQRLHLKKCGVYGEAITLTESTAHGMSPS